MTEFSTWTAAQLYDAIGIAGFGLYVLTYGLLTLNRVDSKNLSYFVLNLMAASLVLIGLVGAFNLASALIQVFWISISIFAIVVRIRNRKEEGFVKRVQQIAAE